MFGRYCLPSDLLVPDSITASAEVSAYGATHAITLTSVRPAKLSTTSGTFTLNFDSPVQAGAIHLVYPNFDLNLAVTLEPAAGTPITISCPGPWENGWYPGIFKSFTPQTADEWVLNISGTNSLTIDIFKILLYPTLRDLGTDVRWGVVEDEEHGDIWHETDGGGVTVDEIWGPRRSFMGEWALENSDVAALLTLFRSSKQRILPWTLIPDVAVNDAWLVRFIENKFSRTRETINHNLFPFRAKEVSRGVPWP